MTQELITTNGGSIAARSAHDMVAEVKTRMAALAELMRDVLKPGIDADYAVIPGTHKPSLLLPGAQKIAVMFKFSPTYTPDDLSTATEARYRVKCTLTGPDGSFLGDATAEWSSAETNNEWRKVNSDDEYDDAPDDMRRVVNKKVKGGQGTYKQKQIRVSRADAAIKGMAMAEKRAFIRAVRAASGASAIFTVHAEEVPAGMAEGNEERPPITQPQAKKSAETTPHEAAGEALVGTVQAINERRGNTNGRDWVAWFVTIGGVDYGTFSDSIASVCQQDQTVRYTWKPGKKANSRELVTAEPVSEAAE
jgi:hypothetical protein